MASSPREARIQRRLALLGDGPAAFYRDACKIIENPSKLETSAHLLAHSLREIESAVRRVLLPVDYQPPAQCTACGSRAEAHKAQVQAILRAYSFPTSDLVFVTWLRLCDPDDLSLHRFAHRDALGSPREIDSTIEELWETIGTFLDALLDRFESRFADHLPLIDDLLRKDAPGKRDVSQLLTRIPHNAVTAEHFFTRASAKWLEPLRKAGVFASPPRGVVKADGSTWFPAWPASSYLARLAEQERESAAGRSVGEAALDIVNAENPWVRVDLANVSLHIPCDVGVRFAPAAASWINLGCSLQLPELIARLAVRLLEAGEFEPARELLEPLLDTTSAGRGSRFGGAEVGARYDAYEFERVVQRIIPQATALDGPRVFPLLCSALEKAAQLAASFPEAEDDGCSFFRPAIENHRQNNPNTQRVLSVLIEAVRDAADSMAKVTPTAVPDVIRELEAHKTLVFRRLVLYVLRRYPTADKVSLARYLLDFDDVESRRVWHERRLLEERGVEHLTPDDRERLLAYLWAGPDVTSFQYRGFSGAPPTDEEVEQRRTRWRIHHLSFVAHALTGDRRAEYDRLVAEKGPPSHPAFHTYIGEVRTGPTSPVGDAELAAMSVEQLFEYLGAWKPSGDFMSPTREGIGRALKKAVGADPTKYINSWERFRGVHPTYIRAIVEGLSTCLTEKRSFSWEHAVGLCAWALTQTQPDEEPSPEAPYSNEDPDWSWTRKAVAEFLRAGFQDGSASLPDQLASRTWEVIAALADEPISDELGGGAPFEQALNTLHGAAIHAALEYALWRSRSTRGRSDAMPDGFASMPDVAALLERHLDPVRDPAPATRALFGLYLAGLMAIDEGWVRGHLAMFFPTASSLAPAREATWTTYVEHAQPYRETLDLVRAEFERSLKVLGDATTTRGGEDRFTEGIIRHLIGLYWQGHIPLASGLLDDFYGCARDSTRGALLKQIGFAFFHAESVDGPIVERARALWDHRREIAGTLPVQARQHELAPFGWWFASRKFEDAWALAELRRLLEGGVYPELDHAVAETLGVIAESAPVPALECMGLLLAVDDHYGWRILACRQGITSTLNATLKSPNATVAKVARELCNRLIARGNPEFKALLDGIPPVAPVVS